MNRWCFFLLCSGLVALCWSCKSEGESTDEAVSTVLSVPTIDEDHVIARCSPWLIDQINTQEEEQHNEVVNIIIDRSWDLNLSEGGIFFHILEEGDGALAKWGTQVLVHYHGYDIDGNIFNSSYHSGKPFKFYVGNVIPGWNQALPMLASGGSGIFVIPSYLAYGQEGFGELVPPGQHLIFYIKLLEILPQD